MPAHTAPRAEQEHQAIIESIVSSKTEQGMQQFSLSIAGANFSNMDNGATRRFEIETCKPGEPIELILESRSPVDPRAVAVFSQRSIQIGYLTAEGGR